MFRVLAEDGTMAYSLYSTYGDEWKNFRAGETTEVRVRFQPRFGGGGTFRIVLDITDLSGVHVLGTDLAGLRFFIPARLGTAGLGDARATIEIDNRSITDHRDMAMVRRVDDSSDPTPDDHNQPVT